MQEIEYNNNTLFLNIINFYNSNYLEKILQFFKNAVKYLYKNFE